VELPSFSAQWKVAAIRQQRRDLMPITTSKGEVFSDATIKKILDAPDPLDAVPRSSAVTLCEQAWVRAQVKEMAEGAEVIAASKIANKSYILAMPPLVGLSNIRDFIACVTHGVLFGAIQSNESTKLLYAAQVALAAHKALRPGE
jgi:hypothetical protein